MLLRLDIGNVIVAVAALCILAAPSLCSQERPQSAAGAFRISLPEYADTTDLKIHYQLIGPFGGYASFVRTKAGVREYTIDTSYEGEPTRSLRAVVYCPGYQVVTLDYPSLTALPGRSAELRLKPLATVPLSGRVSLPPGVEADEVRVDVSLEASWECRFFNLTDCLMTGYKVASAEVLEGGGFSVALPDFAHDPVVGSYERPGRFTFTLSERKTGKYLFRLRPAGGSGKYDGLPIAERYQDVQTFTPEAGR